MANQEWDRFGEEIKRTVQDAVESRNFDQLNQTISRTINDAVNTVAWNVKNYSTSAGQRWSNYQYREPGTQNNQNQNNQNQRNQNQNNPGANTGYSYTYGQPKNSIVLYDKKGMSVGGNVALAICGYMVFIPGAVSALLALIFMLTIPGHLAGFMIWFLISALLAIPFGMMGVSGTRSYKSKGRFKTYLRKLDGRECCNITELADGVGKSTQVVVKDLESMIRKRWFLQGHLDRQKTCLIVTDRMYREYLQLETQKQDYQERLKQSDMQRQMERKAAEMERDERMKKLDPEVRKVLEQGDVFVQKIRQCNDAIPGEEISAKISRMEMIVDRIFDRIEQNPSSVGDIRKLLEYYLPTTVKLLEAYQEMDAQPVGGENIQKAKAEIEATLDTLNAAFEKLLDNLFQDTAWDVSSDISVLNTMLYQEGLQEDGLKKQ